LEFYLQSDGQGRDTPPGRRARADLGSSAGLDGSTGEMSPKQKRVRTHMLTRPRIADTRQGRAKSGLKGAKPVLKPAYNSESFRIEIILIQINITSAQWLIRSIYLFLSHSRLSNFIKMTNYSKFLVLQIAGIYRPFV